MKCFITKVSVLYNVLLVEKGIKGPILKLFVLLEATEVTEAAKREWC